MSSAIEQDIEHVDDATSRLRVRVAMRDGIELATDVYWPAGVGLEQLAPRPALLERTPYGIRAMRYSDGRHADGTPVSPESGAAFFVRRGFVVIRQDCRGRGDSDGVFAKYVGEAEDGVDTHEWLAGRSWCDGRIVTHGVSYSAHTQAATASLGAPHSAAMILDSGGFASAWDAGGRFGGAFELKQAVWAFRRAMTKRAQEAQAVTAAGDASTDAALQRWFTALPWHKGFSPLTSVHEYEDFLFEQWSHEDLDEFWTQPGLYARGHYQNFPPVPVLNICSWYDPYVFSTIENFHALRAKNELTCLVLGPWTHGARSVTYAGDVDFGATATLDGNVDVDYPSFKARWLDGALGTRTASQPPVTYFLMGGGSGRRDEHGRMQHGGRWLTSNHWPPEGASDYSLYLTAAQGLAEQPVAAASISYDFDPRDPAPSLGGGITSGEPLMYGGAFDQRVAAGGASLPISARCDVVSFQTGPLDEPVVVVGEPVLELRFSSSAPDTDLTVKLIDVYPPNSDYPDGFAINLTDGMLRCRYRDDPSSPELMRPEDVYELRIRMPDTANLFQAGHRIRVDISSSNFPRCDVNPNTGRPVMGDRTWQIARNTLHLGTSRLRVTVLPR